MSTDLSAAELDRPEILAAAQAGFGVGLPVAQHYAELLRTEGIERGMIGPREADRLWERHLLNSLAVSGLIPSGSSVVDLGSGAGLPGIPLGIARPELSIVLLEPMQRRVAFLELCLAALAIPNLHVHRGRAEDGLAGRVDVVVVRAVASLEKLVRLSAGLLVPGGLLVALKGQSAADELERLDSLTRQRAELVEVAAPGQSASVVTVRSDR